MVHHDWNPTIADLRLCLALLAKYLLDLIQYSSKCWNTSRFVKLLLSVEENHQYTPSSNSPAVPSGHLRLWYMLRKLLTFEYSRSFSSGMTLFWGDSTALHSEFRSTYFQSSHRGIAIDDTFQPVLYDTPFQPHHSGASNHGRTRPRKLFCFSFLLAFIVIVSTHPPMEGALYSSSNPFRLNLSWDSSQGTSLSASFFEPKWNYTVTWSNRLRWRT